MKTHTKVALLIIIAAAIRMLIASLLNLGDDEALYWTWAKHPAACYYDHPGMVAWLIALSTRLLGDTTLAVRLPTILLGAVSTGLMYALGRQLFSERVGWLAALAFTLTPLFALGSFLVASDAPLGVFWLLTVLAVAHATMFRKRWLLVVAGALAGLALDSKYTAILLVISALLYLVTSRETRREFSRKELYLGALLAAAVFLPVFLWNENNGWDSFRFNLLGRHGAGAPTFRWFPQLLGAELLALSPLLLGALAAALLRLGSLRNSSARYRLLFWFSFPTLALFWGASPFARILPHWPAAGYLTLIVATAALWTGSGGRKARRWWPGAVLGTAAVFTLLLHTQAFWPVLPLPPGDDNTNHLHGWEKVVQVVRSEMRAIEAGGGKALLFADRYQFAAQLAWNMKEPHRSFSLNTAQDQFDFWMARENLIGASGVLVWEEDWDIKPEVLAAFRHTEDVARIPVKRRGKLVRTFHVVRCLDLERIP